MAAGGRTSSLVAPVHPGTVRCWGANAIKAGAIAFDTLHVGTNTDGDFFADGERAYSGTGVWSAYQYVPTQTVTVAGIDVFTGRVTGTTSVGIFSAGSDGAPDTTAPAAMYAQHADAILEELGWGKAQRAHLRTAGVTPPPRSPPFFRAEC